MRGTLGVAVSYADILRNSWRVPPQCPKNVCVGEAAHAGNLPQRLVHSSQRPNLVPYLVPFYKPL